MSTTFKMDVDTLFSQARKLSPRNEKFIGELQEFEEFIEDNAYDIDAFRNDIDQIRDGYLSSSNNKNIREALNVFNKITSIINNNDCNDCNKLIHKKLFNKFNHFTNIQFTIANNNNNILDKYIPFKYNKLKLFELICINNNISLSDYLISNYHSSGLPINEYISENELFNQLRMKYDSLPNNQNISNKYDIMTNYLNEYEKYIYKPLNRLQYLNENTINKYNDNITIIINYIIEINNGIHKILSEKASYPIQFDIFFVAPNMYTELNLHSLNGLCDEIKSDLYSRKNGAVDGIADIYHLLRRAANNINRLNHQRFSMLIIRNNKYDTTADTIYIYKNNNSNIAPKYISDNVELTYLLNTKLTPIIPGHGLYSNNNGILSLTHHLHSNNISKCYLGYNQFKSRIFKYNFLNNLQLIFNSNNFRISENKRIDFNNSYRDFNDLNYNLIGEYYFNNHKNYECFEPIWNKQNCRAMGNVFIPKNCTNDLMKYIDEKFKSCEKLYYKMDYTIGMQIVDKQTVYYKPFNICIINTELHKHGQLLYAIIVKNTYKSKQKWKIINYKNNIAKAFMTKQELIQNYGIFICDLPIGSKIKHNNFINHSNKIKITKQLIRNTHWSHIRIVQSKQNIDASNGNIITISERRFKQLALKSLRDFNNSNNSLISMAQFKFRKNKYHIEKLLPVYIPKYNKYIAISFWYNQNNNNNQNGKTQVSGVCLDLVDIKNKANLIQCVDENSWLNICGPNKNMTINNLIIGGNNKSNKKFEKNCKNIHQKKLYNCNKQQKTNTPMPYVVSKTPHQKQPYVPSKAPTQMIPMSPPSKTIPLSQLSPAIAPMQSMILPNFQTSVPLLVHNSSIGSVGSLPPLCSMPMTSIPSIPSFQPYQHVAQISPHNNISNSMNSMPNMQIFQQNAQYFANFLTPNFFNNNNYNTNYNTQLNQNGYY